MEDRTILAITVVGIFLLISCPVVLIIMICATRYENQKKQDIISETNRRKILNQNAFEKFKLLSQEEKLNELYTQISKIKDI